MTEKKEHPNATMLRWIADGEEIQFKHAKYEDWQPSTTSRILTDIGRNFNFEAAGYTHRIKPKTIRIGKYDVAEPMKEKPAYDTEYWTLNQINEPVCSYTWGDDDCDQQFLSTGLCWLNKEDAELAAKAIKELLTGQ